MSAPAKDHWCIISKHVAVNRLSATYTYLVPLHSFIIPPASHHHPRCHPTPPLPQLPIPGPPGFTQFPEFSHTTPAAASYYCKISSPSCLRNLSCTALNPSYIGTQLMYVFHHWICTANNSTFHTRCHLLFFSPPPYTLIRPLPSILAFKK